MQNMNWFWNSGRGSFVFLYIFIIAFFVVGICLFAPVEPWMVLDLKSSLRVEKEVFNQSQSYRFWQTWDFSGYVLTVRMISYHRTDFDSLYADDLLGF